MYSSPLVEKLVRALQCMPGIGPKSAQRIAFYLLAKDRAGALRLAAALRESADHVRRCQQCQNFSETAICSICDNAKRDKSLLCVVASPADVSSFEQTANYTGLYFVLMGHLSPLDGIGPQDIGLDLLRSRMQAPDLKEVILATGTTPEGEATAHYIGRMVDNAAIRVSRIAYGVPIGGELEYVDSHTLAHALASRREL